jgi:large subunit ribosomal protein L21
MKFAVIKTGGKQYRVTEGQKLNVEKLNTEKDKNIEFDQVLLFADGDKVDIGTPLTKHKVGAKVLEQGKAKKVMVVKYKPKVRYHKAYGHRQPFTQVLIEKIS